MCRWLGGLNYLHSQSDTKKDLHLKLVELSRKIAAMLKELLEAWQKGLGLPSIAISILGHPWLLISLSLCAVLLLHKIN